MRISQIQNLCWGINLLVVAGTCFVGYEFTQVARARGSMRSFEFPQAGKATLPQRRWPGEITKFDHIWKTPVNGLVPKPPEKVKPVPVKRDPRAEFKQAINLDGGWIYTGPTGGTLVFLEQTPGGKKTIRMGECLTQGTHRWQLTSVEFDTVSRKMVLAFRNAAEGVVEIEGTSPGTPFPGLDPDGPVTREPPDPDVLSSSTVSRDKIEALAYYGKDPNHWTIPEDEQKWWRVYGQELVWDKVSVMEHTDPDGKSHGLKFNSTPGEDVAAFTSDKHRGILKGDILRSINGHPVNSREGVIDYLRGEGADADVYDVVIERAGKEIHLRYDIPRRTRS